MLPRNAESTQNAEQEYDRKLENKLKHDNATFLFSTKELIEIIRTTSNNSIRGHAFDVMISRGTVDDLKQVESLIDFTFRPGQHVTFMGTAAMWGNTKVVKWLSEKDSVKSMSDVDKMEVVLHAVNNQRVETLKLLVTPVDQGGVGFPLDFRHPRGLTPLQLAAKNKDYFMMSDLTLPVAEGGYGLVLDKTSLFILEKENKFAMRGKRGKEAGLRYRRVKDAKPERKHSFLEVITPDDDPSQADHVERYVPVSDLGAGRFGVVRLFQSVTNPEHRLTVKRPKLTADTRHDQTAVVDEILDINEEISNSAMVNHSLPQHFFGVKHYVDPKLNRDDYRAVQPYFSGESLLKMVKKDMSIGELLKIMLAVVRALQDMHEHRMIHLDVSVANIIVDDSIQGVDGLPDYIVHLIDHGMTCNKGAMVSFSEMSPLIAPELIKDKFPTAQPSSDVYRLAFNIKCILLELSGTPAIDEMNAAYPSLPNFAKNGINKNPDLRPTLKDFMVDLERDLKSWLAARSTAARLTGR